MSILLIAIVLLVFPETTMFGGTHEKTDHQVDRETRETKIKQDHNERAQSEQAIKAKEERTKSVSELVTPYDPKILIQAVADTNIDSKKYLETFIKIQDIHTKLAAHGPSAVAPEDLAWYLKVMKKTPTARGEVITIIEHLSENPKLVMAHAQEIADAIYAFDFTPDNYTAKVTIKDLNDLSDKQIAMLLAVAKTLANNEKPQQALTILNELINRRTQKSTVLTPDVLQLIKKAITKEQKNNRAFKLTVREMLDTAATNIDENAKNAMTFIDFAELVRQAELLGLDKAIYQNWQQTINRETKKIINQLNTLSPQQFARLALLIPTVVPMALEQSPENSIILLNKLIDGTMLNADNFVEILAMEKMALNSMKAETFKALINAKKLPDIVSLFTKIAKIMGMEGLRQEQRVALHKYVTDLTQAYLDVLARNNVFTPETINSKTLKAMEAETLITLGQITQALMEQEPALGLDLLAQLIDMSLITPDNFDRIMAIQKATIDSIKPGTLAALIKANKMDYMAALLTKIVRLENNQTFDEKQREVLERHVADLLQSFITVLQPAKNNALFVRKIETAMDKVVENAKDMLSLTRSIKTLDAMKALITEKQIQQWLQIIASKAQEIRKSDITPAKLNASLNMAALATKAGLDMKTYQQWIKNIVNEAIDLFAMNKLQDREITMEMIDTMQSAAQLLQTQMVFDGLTRLTVEELRNYINKIKAHQTDLINTIDGLLLTQPENSKAIDAKKQILDETYATLIKKLEANYQIREKAKRIVQ
jgi:urease gamma subunit